MSQLDMFGAGPRETPSAPTPESIRTRLDSVLQLLRVAQEMPWSSAQTQSWRVVVPQMANWLPKDEAEAVRTEFAALLDRLQSQTA